LILAGLNNLLLEEKARETARFSGQLEFIYALSQEAVDGDPDKEWRQEQAFLALENFEPDEYGAPATTTLEVCAPPGVTHADVPTAVHGISDEIDALSSLMDEVADTAPLTKPVTQFSTSTAEEADASMTEEGHSHTAAGDGKNAPTGDDGKSHSVSEKDIWGADGLIGFMDSMKIALPEPTPTPTPTPQAHSPGSPDSADHQVAEKAVAAVAADVVPDVKQEGSTTHRKINIKCTWCGDTKLVRVLQSVG
jgi:hypothetical protein